MRRMGPGTTVSRSWRMTSSGLINGTGRDSAWPISTMTDRAGSPSSPTAPRKGDGVAELVVLVPVRQAALIVMQTQVMSFALNCFGEPALDAWPKTIVG